MAKAKKAPTVSVELAASFSASNGRFYRKEDNPHTVPAAWAEEVEFKVGDEKRTRFAGLPTGTKILVDDEPEEEPTPAKK